MNTNATGRAQEPGAGSRSSWTRITDLMFSVDAAIREYLKQRVGGVEILLKLRAHGRTAARREGRADCRIPRVRCRTHINAEAWDSGAWKSSGAARWV